MRTSIQTIALVSAVLAAGCSPTAEPTGGVDTTVNPTSTPTTGGMPTTGGSPTTANTTGGSPTTANTTGGSPTTANTTGGVPSTTPSTGTTTGTTPSTEPPGPVTCETTDKTTIAIAESAWVPKECNNFGIQGAWYCYDDMVNPSGCVADTPPWDATKSGMCLMGSTTVDETYAAWGAGIGFSLNATPTTDTAAGMKLPYDATANHVLGFKVVITGDVGDLPLRISFKNQEGEAETPAQLQLPGVGTYMVLFEDAVVPEWAEEGADEPANPANLYDVQIQVAGGDVAANYNFCVTELTPITDGTTTPTATLANYGSPQSGQYDTIQVGKYVIQNNRYGGVTHSIQAMFDNGDKVGFALSGVAASVGVGEAPGSYPSIIYGWHVDGKFYGGYTAAKQISAITSIPTTADVTVPGAPAVYNASYDLWVANSATLGAGGARTEVMIWLMRPGMDPYPIGERIGTTTIGGMSWEVWYDTDIGADGFHTVSFIQGTLRTASLDLKPFLDYAVTSGYLQATQYLLGVQFGFEIWQGSASDVFKVNSYSVSIN